MAITIEQRIEDLLKHTGVWDETKDTLRDLLADEKAGTLDADDASYVEGLHKKMFGDRGGGAPTTPTKPSPSRIREMAAKPANDDTAASSTRRDLTAADLIDALREDVANLVIPGDMNERPAAEQTLRGEILDALQATLNELAAKKES